MSFLHPSLVHLDDCSNIVLVVVYKASYKGITRIKIKLLLVFNKAMFQILQMMVMTKTRSKRFKDYFVLPKNLISLKT